MTVTNPYPPQPPQPYGAPQPLAPKKRKKWPFVVGGVVLLLIIIGIANGGSTPTTTTPAASTSVATSVATAAAPAGVAAPAAPVAAEPAAKSGTTVVYEVTGPSKASVTYTKEGFQMEQVTSAKLPFRKELQFSDEVSAFTGLSIVAQNAGSGDITCRILVDGKEVASSTSSGAYAVVTCTGANA